MTLDERESQLPWGLHDAYVEGIALDFLQARAVLDVRVMMSEAQDLDQRARLVIEGLVFCAIEAPQAADGPIDAPAGLWIDAGVERTPPDLPPVPAGCFLHYFFVHPWNRFIHICGRNAALEWREAQPVPARADTRASFPDDEIPDPE